MKVIDHINSAKSTLLSFELLPPKVGNISTVLNCVEGILEYNPSWINVTSHANMINSSSDGYIYKRPGTLGICGVLQNKYKIDAVPHVLCQGFTKNETEDLLIELDYLGIHNILALQGDKIYNQGEHSNHYAIDLVKQVSSMKQGEFLTNTSYTPLDFCIGVAGYPEKHGSAISFDEDLLFLKNKVNAGAEYIVTQMFFNNQDYFNFVNKCRAVGINVPIIPGLKILKNQDQVKKLEEIFNINIPDNLKHELLKNNLNEQELLLDYTINQCKELIKFNVPSLHFYLMNEPTLVSRVLNSIYK